ncbi:MAG: Ig-like domain-containing protein, partial [Longimicrobiales bacterium]
MRSAVRLLRLTLGVVAAFYVASCVDESLPSAVILPQSALIVLSPSIRSARADEPLQVNRIRLTVWNVQTNAVLTTVTEDVDPNQTEWGITVDIDLSGSHQLSVRVDIELIHVSGVVEEVRWSGRTGVLMVRPSEETQAPETPLYSGGLDNLSVTSIRIGRPVPTLTEGDTLGLTVTVEGGSGTPQVFWRLSDQRVATVSAAGLLSALLPGSTDIIAEAGPQADTVTVIVVQRVASVEIEPVRVALASLGDTATYTARVLDPRGEDISGQAVTWSARDADVAEDLGEGVFRALANGDTWVIAAAGGDAQVLDSAELVVSQEAVSIEVTPAGPVTLTTIGATHALSAVAKDSGGTTISGVTFTWASDATGVATVAGDGAVTAVADGSANITASASGVTSNAVALTVAQ